MLEERRVSLNEERGAELINMIGSLNLGDNQVLGKVASRVLTHLFGGRPSKIGQQHVWVDPRGMTCALVAGTNLTNFRKSNQSGFGRSGNDPKEGDMYINIQYLKESHEYLFTFYSPEEVIEILSGVGRRKKTEL